FDEHLPLFNALKENLTTDFQGNSRISNLVHSIRVRVKDVVHLREKLCRKIKACREAGKEYEVTPDNMFLRINDLVGIRLIYLHTDQFGELSQAIQEVLDECRYNILEGPTAKVWDDDYRSFFEKLNIKTEHNERMYTSVHYVIEPNRKTRLTAEIQVRTLAEELWGEVDHSINYPTPSKDEGCRDQIKVLARVTLGCTRLVDSIFASHRRHGKE
ncbi:RelA/SpoT domain-containing protein, partial [Dokdonella sp.]|uniref:RelA/SpoT domain-containing protein n=1 Tax=Dokdonella sp. TaxID=2291710 RepID=UPI002D19A9DC